MSQSSQASWQRGILSIPTQFWAYNARMLEMMVGKTFTPIQRARLVVSQLLLYGSAGLPIVPWISDWAKAADGNPKHFSLDTGLGIADRGLLDAVMYHVTGSDTQKGKRLGTGGWLGQTIQDLFGLSQYGEKSVVEMWGGATLAILGQTAMQLADVVKYSNAEMGQGDMPLTREALVRLASNVSSVGNALKAEMVLNHHIYITGKGSTLSNNVPDADAFGVLLGYQPGVQADASVFLNHSKKVNEEVKDAVRIINNYRTQWINEPNRRAEIEEEINHFSRLLPNEVRIKSLKRVHNDIQPGLYESLAKQFERDQALTKGAQQ
jgi:hypothetical protein